MKMKKHKPAARVDQNPVHNAPNKIQHERIMQDIAKAEVVMEKQKVVDPSNFVCQQCCQKATQTHYCFGSSKKSTDQQSPVPVSEIETSAHESDGAESTPTVRPETNRSFFFYVSQIKKAFQRKYRIAILTPRRNCIIDQASFGFIDDLQGRPDLAVEIETYNAGGDKQFLRKILLPYIAQQNFDLLYTVGAECTNAAAQFFSNRLVRPHIIFSGIYNPHEFGLDAYARDYVTGVRAERNCDLHVELLSVMKPDLKRVVIVYRPDECGGATAQLKEEMQRFFELRGVMVSAVVVNSVDEVVRAVEPVLVGADLVLVLRDHTVLAALRELINVCMRWKIPLCTSDLYSLQDGASLGFGSVDSASGKLAAQSAYAILHDGMPIREVPFVDARERFYMLVNSSVMYQQGLYVKSNTLATLEHIWML